MTRPDERWRERAACAGLTDLFFPVAGKNPDGHSDEPAKLVCMGCTVFVDCLAWVRANPQRHGIWAGMNPHERDQDMGRRKQRSTALR